MAKFKVYYTIELNEVATHIFESNDFEVKLCSHNDEETYVKELAEFQPDAIMCRTEPITAKMMDTCKNLKVIGKQGAGLDNIDMDHAHAKDITVVYAPAGNANAVAEHAVMLMLMCAKRFTYVDRQFRGGNFLVRMGMEHTYELGGKTLGMIGCGRISQLAMQKCKYGFGMNVIGYDPYLTQDKIGDLCELKATAKEVWEQADFVSVHLPVVPSTEHSIGREQFSWMKPTASFINCARGALIKENELVECLKDGTLFQAGLDVFEHEPIQESSRELFNLDNVIMTPHMAATTEQSVRLSEPRRHNIDLRAAQQIEDTVAGEVKVQSIKHVLVVVPKTDTGGTIAPAAPTNGSGEYSVRYWATYIDGKKVREVDQLNFICYVNGTDYLADVRKALGM